ncbi:MAG TPA: DinB family protein [Anaerolineales bacterium]
MYIKIGLENGIEGRSLVWVLDHPGCFAYGHDGHEALHNLPAAIQDYVDWIILHGEQPWLQALNQDFEAEEVWEVYSIDENYDLYEEGYEVNAWFLHDWKPLAGQDVERGLSLLSWSRADLMETVRGLSQPFLEAKRPNERWSISGILNHVGSAEWWYLDRLGLSFPRQDLPDEPLERMEKVRARLVAALPGLAGSRQVVGVDGEIWSPRKLLRRAIWHERDHTFHIRSLLDRP